MRVACLCLLFASIAEAQVCRLSVAGLNRARRVMGPVHTECPGQFHTSPFGNWGAASNFGGLLNGRQFDGWCHDSLICDNTGFCRSNCRDGWYEWNSCTDHPTYSPPNCSLFNDKDCTEQKTTTDVNVLGTRVVDQTVSCPIDTDGDGTADRGGCQDLATYTHGANFMSLYELDPLTGNDLVQTMYFPPTPVSLRCTPMGCAAAGSDWVQPIGYDSPASPAKVFAEMAMAVNSGTFMDPSRACRSLTQIVRSVSSASFAGTTVAADSIVSGFGPALATTTESASTLPLPVTLGGVSVRITDSRGTVHAAPLLLVSPAQINYVVPAGVAAGEAAVAVLSGAATRAAGTLQVETVAPGIFTANADGKGVPAAIAVRVTGGVFSYPAVFACPSGAGSCRPEPLDLGGAQEQLVLVLFGTGIRGRSALAAVSATVGGIAAEVQYAGAQGSYAGLDQVNLLVPRTAAGRGEVDVTVTVDGRPANVVRINVR
jgi:uncharacterized protein (TIGR03437 family)